MHTKLKFIILIFALNSINFNVYSQFTSKLSIGFKGGANVGIVLPTERFSVFTNSNEPDGLDKDYTFFMKNIASQYHFLIYYRFNELNYIGILPGLYSYAYKYKTLYDWTGSNSLSTRFEYKQLNNYIDIPIVYKQKIRHGDFQPYFQLGAFYSMLEQSKKEITTFETEASLNTGEIEFAPELIPTEENFIFSNAGVLGGIGLAYNFKRTQIGIESNFRYTVHNISNSSNRYDNYRTLGKYYDINDDIMLMSWSISLVYLVDLKCVIEKIPARYENLKE